MPVRKQGTKTYRGKNCDLISYPMGGIGAGMICIDGTGSFSHVSLRHKPEVFNEPMIFSALHVKGVPTARVIEAATPKRKIFEAPGAGTGKYGKTYGLPRFSECSFHAKFPFADISLSEKSMPLKVSITGWSPFIPGDTESCSLPVAGVEYKIRNTSHETVEVVYSFHAANFISSGNNANAHVRMTDCGFVITQPEIEGIPSTEGSFAAFVSDHSTKVDCAWFRGGWFDPLSILWNNVKNGCTPSNPPHADGNSGNGGSLYVPFTLKPKEEKIIHLQFAWHVPNSDISYGYSSSQGAITNDWQVSRLMPQGADIRLVPYVGLKQDADWKPVPSGHFVDVHTLRGSKGIVYISRKVHLKTSGKHILQVGHDGGVRIFIDENPVAATAGTINPAPVKRTPVQLDLAAGEHEICVALDRANGNGWGIFVSLLEKCEDSCCCSSAKEPENSSYIPWYATRFSNVEEVASYWRANYSRLHAATEKFSNCFHRSTLPQEIVDAVSANLTILKSPTVLRDKGGRMWGWEGCGDANGSCAGSCTHVWNYAQSLPHLLPEFERSLRQTEFNEAQFEDGLQNFRHNLPISKSTQRVTHAASDGQLGGIMKLYRDWRIKGDDAWLKDFWPKAKKSLDYCIRTWDPDHVGVLIEPHHNTYDIEFWGPDGMCSSFYLGALKAASQMGAHLGETTPLYDELYKKGRKYLEQVLFNGEYFEQKIMWQGLHAKSPLETGALYGHDFGYSTEAVELLKKDGPKYQYGKGCLSDGVIGAWMAEVCGVGEILDPEKVKSHLLSVYKYNLKHNLSDHVNPQRPGYALGKEGGLLLCTWPRGGRLSLPFVYSEEVWTGIEYQVASHLMLMGCVSEGLEIVRILRQRYDGSCRNPYNEYECGHWYARAMASYALIQGITGIRYDAVDRTLHIEPRIKGDFKSFISTSTGYGLAGVENGKPFIKVYEGNIDIEKVKYTACDDIVS